MAAPIVYKSTDGSAPVLTGAVGSLIALLDACLVNGYGAKAAAGWTKAFSATNAAAYRWGGGTQFYWNVDDNGGGTGGAREARTALYETMSAVATGTSKTPAATVNVVVRKSATADSTARPWVIVADDRTCYIFIKAGDTGDYLGTHVGDFIALGSDPWKAAIFGRVTENSSAASTEQFMGCTQVLNATTGHYAIKSQSGVTIAQTLGKHGAHAFCGGGSATYLNGGLPYPNPYDLNVYIAPVMLGDGNGGIRGRVRGLWHWLHPIASIADGDTFTATGLYAGRTFMLVTPLGGSSTSIACIETSAWDT